MILLYFTVFIAIATAIVGEEAQHPLLATGVTGTAHVPEVTPPPDEPVNFEKTTKKHETSVSDAIACQVDIGTDYDYCTEPGITSTTRGYTVSYTSCPTLSTWARLATGIGSSEASWLVSRSLKVSNGFRSYTSNAWQGIPQYTNLPGVPRVGIAVSGGGYRAMLNGVGVLQAFNGSDHNAVTNGTGGLLDSALYTTGLSGGAWAVGSWALYGWKNMYDLLQYWDFTTDSNQAMGTKWVNPFNDNTTCYPIQCEARMRAQSWFAGGLPISFADNWHRLIARDILSRLDAGQTWSSLRMTVKFANGDVPMPIIVATGRITGEDTYVLNATVYEFSPFEFGSWDPETINGFTPVQYIGSPFVNGRPRAPYCMTGLDNAAYVLGTSSLAFNSFLVKDADFTLQQSTSNMPNPFFLWGGVTSNETLSNVLYLADGGENLQNIPILPLLQRQMDVIVAVDSSADTGDGLSVCCGYNWPNGTALITSYNYAVSPKGQKQRISMPVIPPMEEWVRRELNARPTFFGCNKIGSNPAIVPPMIVYLPNAPYTAYSNATTASTVDWEFGSIAEDLITNGFALGITGLPQNGIVPPWPTCLACAVVERQRDRANIPRSTRCQTCFDYYCWENKPPRNPPPIYNPTPIPSNAGPPAQRLDGAYCWATPVCWYELGCDNACNYWCPASVPTDCPQLHEYSPPCCFPQNPNETVDALGRSYDSQPACSRNPVARSRRVF